MATIQQIHQVRDLHESELLALPNVVGIATGYRAVGGQKTDQLAIIVYVEKKLPEGQLRQGDIVPKLFRVSLGGERVDVPTDVRETGRFHPLKNQSRDATYAQRKRPAQAGYSIGLPGDVTGTLGMLVVRDEDHRGYLLTNNHVIVHNNSSGGVVLQPAEGDGGRAGDAIADTFQWAVIDPNKDNYMDAAIALIRDYSSVDPTYPQIGPLLGWYPQLMWQWQLRKVGRTTGLTEARIADWNATVAVDYAFGTVNFAQQVMMYTSSPPGLLGGDSGSVWVTNDRYAGLLNFAGSDEGDIVATPIDSIMRTFGLKVWSNTSRSGELITGGRMDVNGDIDLGKEAEKAVSLTRIGQRGGTQ